MKQYLLVAAFLLTTHFTYAQHVLPVRPLPIVPVDSSTQRISYRGKVAAPDLLAAELYGRAQEWVALQFEQYESVIQLADAGRGVLIGKAMTTASAPALRNQDAKQFNLLFRFSLRIQAGVLHYEFTDISYPDYPATSAIGNSSNAMTADALVEWLRRDEYSHISTVHSQRYRQPVEPQLRDNTQYTDKGEPRPRMLQQCLGIEQAMTALTNSLQQYMVKPQVQ
ncbi:hypothetical protein GCM10027346_33210 [Hymenobacter seoulensis]